MASGKIPPVFRGPKHPKPKFKGKKSSLGKFNLGPSIKSLDVFKANLSADAGAESSHDSSDSLAAYIQSLSGSQLSRLERMINKIRDKMLSSKEEHKSRYAICDEVTMVITERVERSAVHEAQLTDELRDMLSQLSITAAERSKRGSLKRICVDGRWQSIESFIKRAFREQVECLSTWIANDEIIRPQCQYGPVGMIKRYIDRLLREHNV